jgi:hypothetical protein
MATWMLNSDHGNDANDCRDTPLHPAVLLYQQTVLYVSKKKKKPCPPPGGRGSACAGFCSFSGVGDVEESEFLTHETTCPSEMLEKTTCEIFCQKRPPTSGGTPGQATRGTCRLGQCRQAPAAVAVAGTYVSVRRRSAGWALPPSSLPAR